MHACLFCRDSTAAAVERGINAISAADCVHFATWLCVPDTPFVYRSWVLNDTGHAAVMTRRMYENGCITLLQCVHEKEVRHSIVQT